VTVYKLTNLPSDAMRDYRESPFTPPILSDLQRTKLAEQKKLMCRKGVYPYSYFNNWSKFEETSLPSKEHFYNNLTDTHVSDKDYLHAQNVFTSMNMQSLKDYHDFYLYTDTILLADVFETFRDMCITNYCLDPAHFYTSPGLSWQAALKMTEVKLELLTDPEMYLFIESGIRGGVSTITQRFAEANNHYMEDYDPSKLDSYLVYWDANNLYGHSMSRHLPTCEFRWLDDKEKEELDVMTIGKEDDYGFILEVDLGKYNIFSII